MKHEWWLWKSEFSDEVIDDIIERCEVLPIEDAKILGGDGINDHSVRKSEVRWANKDSELREIIWEYGNVANKKAFGFDITNKFDIQFTTYKGKDKSYYTWHTDNNWLSEGYYDRKISLIIQLSDPSDYEGGKFEFETDEKIISPEGFEKKGSIIAFPSFMKHRINPITKGTRHSLVTWIEGPHFR